MNPKKAPVHDLHPPDRGRVYRLTYSNARPDDDPKIFQCRDAMAFCELNAALGQLGYQYGTTIHLYPDDERPLGDFPAFQTGDMLVLTTRPPLHDRVGIIPPHRKVIRAAKTDLQAVLFQALSNYFEYCTRKHVQLTKHGANCILADDPAKWTHVELYEYSGAEILRHFVGPQPVKPNSERHSTIAFFLRTDRLPTINCDFVASFGMDGLGTLLWNRIIRCRYPEWLASPRFVAAELVYKHPLPCKPLTPEFVDDGKCIEVRLLTELPKR